MLPASAASSTSSLSEKAVSTSTAGPLSWVIRRAAATPSILGILTSITTRSGLRSCASLTACSPSPASPTTVWPPSSRVSTTSTRIRTSSSATTTRAISLLSPRPEPPHGSKDQSRRPAESSPGAQPGVALCRSLVGPLDRRHLVTWGDAPERARGPVPAGERFGRHRRAGQLRVGRDQLAQAHQLEVPGPAGHHQLVVQPLEDAVVVLVVPPVPAGPALLVHEHLAPGHARADVAPDRPERHHGAARHVLAAVVTGALDHGGRTRVANGEALARAARAEQLTAGGAVEHGVAEQHGRARVAVGRPDHDAAAGREPYLAATATPSRAPTARSVLAIG